MNTPTSTSTKLLFSASARVMLLQRVLVKAYDETESWKDDHVGMALAYLAKAITDPEEGSSVDWTDANGNPGTACVRELFRSWFTPEDPVWLFIRV